MKTYFAGASETRVSGGKVLLALRFASDEEVIQALSPEWARVTAENLLASADEAEEDEAQSREKRTQEVRQEQRSEVLDDMGVARLEDPPAPKPRRTKKVKRGNRTDVTGGE